MDVAVDFWIFKSLVNGSMRNIRRSMEMPIFICSSFLIELTNWADFFVIELEFSSSFSSIKTKDVQGNRIFVYFHAPAHCDI